MKTRILFILLLFTVQIIAYSASCPTCPKDRVISRVDEFAIAQKQATGLPNTNKFQDKINSHHLAKITKLQKTPIEIVASRTEQLKKAPLHTREEKLANKMLSPGKSKWEGPWQKQHVTREDIENSERIRMMLRKHKN